MQKRVSKFEPAVYLPEKTHLDYRKEATRYALGHILSERKLEKWQAKGAPSRYHSISAEVGELKDTVSDLIDLIERGWRPVPFGKGSPTFSDKAADHVIQAIHMFGVDALRLLPIDEQTVSLSGHLKTGQ